MKRATWMLATLALLSGGVGQARADIITGPDLNQNISGYMDTGLEFTALTNTTLQGFVYQNQGRADAIVLESANHTVLQTLEVPAGNPSFTASNLNWPLTAGEDYFLLAIATNPSNGRFAGDGFTTLFPVSDSDLRVNYGVFIPFLTQTQFAWADFNDLTTGPATTVPEPTSLALFGLATATLAGYFGWRRRNQPVSP